jgi:hypothetical protein
MDYMKNILEHNLFNDVWWHLCNCNSADITEDENIFFDVYSKYCTDKDIILKTPGIVNVLLKIIEKYEDCFD